MITLEIADLNEPIQVQEIMGGNDPMGGSICLTHVHCQITGAELLDAIALYKNTLLELGSDDIS